MPHMAMHSTWSINLALETGLSGVKAVAKPVTDLVVKILLPFYTRQTSPPRHQLRARAEDTADVYRRAEEEIAYRFQRGELVPRSTPAGSGSTNAIARCLSKSSTRTGSGRSTTMIVSLFQAHRLALCFLDLYISQRSECRIPLMMISIWPHRRIKLLQSKSITK